MNNTFYTQQLKTRLDALEETKRLARTKAISHKERIRNDLKRLGISGYGLHNMESRRLHKIIHEDEELGGVIHGIMDGSTVMIVATNKRVVFLDCKPLFINHDDISYSVVSGVNYTHAGIWSTVTLHTRIKDFHVQTYNETSAEIFINYLREHSIESTSSNKNYKW